MCAVNVVFAVAEAVAVAVVVDKDEYCVGSSSNIASAAISSVHTSGSRYTSFLLFAQCVLCVFSVRKMLLLNVLFF